jgi:creatinine amidohydrolase
VPDSPFYAELTPHAFRLRLAAAPIAYLPLGTLEWHGEHLPLGADGLQAQGVFVQLAHEVGGIILPPLFMGPDSSQVADGRPYYGMDTYGFPPGQPEQLTGSAYWLPADLFTLLLENILQRLARAGFKVKETHRDIAT